jgi:subtilisin family serine protease
LIPLAQRVWAVWILGFLSFSACDRPRQPTIRPAVSPQTWPSSQHCPVELADIWQGSRGEFESRHGDGSDFRAAQQDPIARDPLFGFQWGLLASGQDLGGNQVARAGATEAPLAWGLVGPAPDEVFVAVVDSPVDRMHGELRPAFFRRTERPGVDGDEDGNGLDDPGGWDFISSHRGRRTEPRTSIHGTLIASIIGALRDGYGVVGVAPEVSMIDASVMDELGNVDAFDALCAVMYLVDLKRNRRVNLVAANLSWGGHLLGRTETLRRALEALSQEGVIVVSAAGNSDVTNGVDIDAQPYYPASWSLPYHIRVTGINYASGDHDSSFNYGRSTVDIAAPGVAILGAMPGNPHVSDPSAGVQMTGSPWGFAKGTSVAAPFVTGTVALLHQIHPGISSSEVLRCIVQNVVETPLLRTRVRSRGRLNTYRAALCAARLRDGDTSGAPRTHQTTRSTIPPRAPLGGDARSAALPAR